jgi:hypothetical protein
MLTMKIQGTVLRILSSTKDFIFTSNPDRLGSLSVSNTKFVRELTSLSERQTLDKRQVWNGERAVSLGMFS